MERTKTFDCLAMKDVIQAENAQLYAEMPDEERWQSVERRLAESDDIVARKWRALCKRHAAETK